MLRVESLRPHEQVTFQVADATALPFEDDAFDVVVCQFGVMLFDREAEFREVHRTLKRGARYLFSVWDSRRYNPFASVTFEVMKRFFPSNPPQFLEQPVSCFEIDLIKETLIRSGFDQIIVSVKRREHDILDVPAFARGLVFSPLIEENKRARRGRARKNSRGVGGSVDKKVRLKPHALPHAGHTVRS